MQKNYLNQKELEFKIYPCRSIQICNQIHKYNSHIRKNLYLL